MVLESTNSRQILVAAPVKTPTASVARTCTRLQMFIIDVLVACDDFIDSSWISWHFLENSMYRFRIDSSIACEQGTKMFATVERIMPIDILVPTNSWLEAITILLQNERNVDNAASLFRMKEGKKGKRTKKGIGQKQYPQNQREGCLTNLHFLFELQNFRSHFTLQDHCRRSYWVDFFLAVPWYG